MNLSKSNNKTKLSMQNNAKLCAYLPQRQNGDLKYCKLITNPMEDVDICEIPDLFYSMNLVVGELSLQIEKISSTD